MNCKQGRSNEEKARNIKTTARKKEVIGAGRIEWERLGKIEEEARKKAQRAHKIELEKYLIPKISKERKRIQFSGISSFGAFKCRF
jgi:hypothetical protein